MAILVTGGAGYIGSHTTLALLERGDDVIVVDNLINSSEVSLKRIEEISGKEPTFYYGDVSDARLLKDVFSQHKISTVIHFAGLKSVGESIKKPLEYYHNNLSATLTLLQ